MQEAELASRFDSQRLSGSYLSNRFNRGLAGMDQVAGDHGAGSANASHTKNSYWEISRTTRIHELDEFLCLSQSRRVTVMDRETFEFEPSSFEN